MQKFITSLFFGILVIYPISAFSMGEEDEDIVIEGKKLVTPANSTRLFYQAAHTAYTRLKPSLGSLDSMYLDTTYKTNILQDGHHAGIPENQWTVRGSSKATNQSLLREVCAVYSSSYTWEPGALTVNAYSHNEIEKPYIEYSAPYTPHLPAQMTDLERACVESLRDPS